MSAVSTTTTGDLTSRALADFGLMLLQELSSASGGQNTILSPLGVAITMAMAHNAAGGHTREALARGLGFDRRAPEENIRRLTVMARGLPSPDRLTQLYVANGMWVREDRPVSSTFIEANRLIFQSEIAPTDFGPPVIPHINGWLNRFTHGKIPKIVDRTDHLGDLALVSAAYFKGFWSKGFERRLTENRPFTLANGRHKVVPMMSTWGRYVYIEDGDVQGVRLAYLGEEISMYLFVPSRESSLAGLTSGLTAERLDGWMAALYKSDMEGRSIHLEMPRFRAETEVVLNPALQALGMGLAFDARRAEFDSLCPDCPVGFRIGMVRHTAALDVDEEGTEAGAATWTGSSLDDGDDQIPEMTVDRPFLIAVRDDTTGGLLFLGAINEP